MNQETQDKATRNTKEKEKATRRRNDRQKGESRGHTSILVRDKREKTTWSIRKAKPASKQIGDQKRGNESS